MNDQPTVDYRSEAAHWLDEAIQAVDTEDATAQALIGIGHALLAGLERFHETETDAKEAKERNQA